MNLYRSHSLGRLHVLLRHTQSINNSPKIQWTKLSQLQQHPRVNVGLTTSGIHQKKCISTESFVRPYMEDFLDGPEVSYPLTKKEALQFLENVLKIPNPEALCEENKIAFLNRLSGRMCRALPFSNIILLSTERDNRVAPTLEECKDDIFSCRGGSCFAVNTFNKALLELMGYKCRFVPADDAASQGEYSHTGLIVEDLRYPGSKDLVEVGTKYPFFEIIPLDFDKESPEYHFGHIRCKFFKMEEGKVAWYLGVNKNRPNMNVLKSDGKLWLKKMTYVLNLEETLPLSMLTKLFNIVWPNPNIVPEVHAKILVLGYSGRDYVSIAGKHVSVVHPDHSEYSEVVTSKTELVEKFQKYFPQFQREVVVKAIDNTINSW